MCACLGACAHEVASEGIRLPGTGIAGGVEPPDNGDWDWDSSPQWKTSTCS